MLPEFLFSGLTSRKKDYVQALTKITDGLESILEVLEKLELSVQAKDDENAKSHIKNIEWQIDKFPFSTFQFLEKSFYLRRHSRLKNVEVETKKTLSSLEKKIAVMQKNGKSQEKLPENDQIIEINRQISSLTRGVESFYSKINLATRSIYLVPLVAVYFLGVYYRLGKGFEVVSEKILWPEQAYVTSESDRDYYKFSKPYAEKYWLEFSKYYFERKNNFEKLYARDDDLRKYLSDINSKDRDINSKDLLEKAVTSGANYGYEDSPDGSRRYFQKIKFGKKNSLVAKLVLQNDSKTKPVMVHDLNVKLDLTDDLPFPWKNLVVTANVKQEEMNNDIPEEILYKELNSRDYYLSREIKGEEDYQKFVRLEDAGIGPVIDLNWTVTANKLILIEGKRELIYNKPIYISVNKAPSNYSFFVPRDDGLLKYPFFLKGSTPAAPKSTACQEEPYFKFSDVCYEKIRTSERLCQITKCTKTKEVEIDYSFYSLRG
ncbi:MAG: hypothetical protein ACW963_10685, partial [Candidatus Sifarchaeia archaeon]